MLPHYLKFKYEEVKNFIEGKKYKLMSERSAVFRRCPGCRPTATPASARSSTACSSVLNSRFP